MYEDYTTQKDIAIQRKRQSSRRDIYSKNNIKDLSTVIHNKGLALKRQCSIIKDREESVTKNAHPCDNWEIKFAQALFQKIVLSIVDH